MLPELEENGYLPPGLHPANLEEIVREFGQASELRRVQAESLAWLLGLARRAGVLRVAINGSFVSSVEEPNDVDCVLLIGPGFPGDPDAERELLDGLPFLDIQLVDQDGWDELVGRVFGTDRGMVPKGLVEVISWN